MSRLREQLNFTSAPNRLPGQGEIELEPVAGDLQLTRPRRPGSERPPPKRRKIHAPYTDVPRSGVYDVVDEEGNYLESQMTCHQGQRFAPSTNPKALDEFRRVRAKAEAQAARSDGQVADEKLPFGYGYALAYEAHHLQTKAEQDKTIHEPGTGVRISGVYNAVDFEGEYLHCQRACVKGEAFPLTKGLEPGGYGYMLEYEAEHLSGE